MTRVPKVRIRTRMTGRAPDEAERVSSPLELLFDLTFVVAVAQVASQLARSIAGGTVLADGLLPYCMVFFAIWWAWINFTWFASAYDTDDVPYRLLTMLQMGGVLVLAAGVQAAFGGSFVALTVGYVLMRVAMVAQWGRAGVENPEQRALAFRYAGAIVVVQAAWVLRLFLPPSLGIASFFVLMVAEVLVPVYAERRGLSPWHPHHIAERYGLFTIILLGESVSATTIAVQGIVTEGGLSTRLMVVAIAGLVLLFSLWWLYFLESPGKALAARRSRSFLWGYGHYFLFAAVAAIGTGLEVAVEAPARVPPVEIGYALGVPVALFFIALCAVNALVGVEAVTRPAWMLGAAVTVLLAPLATPLVGVPGSAALMALIAAVVTASSMFGGRMQAAAAAE